MPRDPRVVTIQAFVLYPVNDVPILWRPARMCGPAGPLFAWALSHTGENDGLIALSHDARIEHADHVPIGMTGTDVLGAEQQMCGETFDHRWLVVRTACRVPLAYF